MLTPSPYQREGRDGSRRRDKFIFNSPMQIGGQRRQNVWLTPAWNALGPNPAGALLVTGAPVPTV